MTNDLNFQGCRMREKSLKKHRTTDWRLSLTYHSFSPCSMPYCYCSLSHTHFRIFIYNRKRKRERERGKIRYATSPYSTVKWLIWCIWYRSNGKMNRIKASLIFSSQMNDSSKRLDLIPISSSKAFRFFSLSSLLSTRERLSTLINRMQSHPNTSNSCLEISIIIKKNEERRSIYLFQYPFGERKISACRFLKMIDEKKTR